MVDWAADVLTLLKAALNSIEGDVRGRVAAAAAGGTGGGSDAVWREEAVCLDEVQEALALAARAASNLTVAPAWKLAADLGTLSTAARQAAARGPAVQLSLAQETGPRLVAAMQWWRHTLLPPAQLLACQPHRLLAAACALQAALPDLQVFNSQKLEFSRQRLCFLVPGLLVTMAAHGTLSGRVRAWLAPSQVSAASSSSGCGSGGSGGSNTRGKSGSGAEVGGGGSSGSGAEPEACAGCLEAPVTSVAKRALRTAPSLALHAPALLQVAAGPGGGTEGRAEADGGFRQFAAAVGERMWVRSQNSTLGSLEEVSMPDGSLPSNLLAGELDGVCGLLPSPPPAAPSGALPLALPAGGAAAAARVRQPVVRQLRGAVRGGAAAQAV